MIATANIMAFLYLPLYNIYDQMTILVMIVWPALISPDRSITIMFFLYHSICKLMYLGDGRIVFNFSDPWRGRLLQDVKRFLFAIINPEVTFQDTCLMKYAGASSKRWLINEVFPLNLHYAFAYHGLGGLDLLMPITQGA